MVLGLLGILLGLAVLVGLAYRGWSILVLAPVGALIAAALSREPLLAHWTETFMRAAAGFFGQFFPLFLLGGVFGKLMDDTGAIRAVAAFMIARLGAERAVLAVVIVGALVTYGGVNLMVAFFVLAPMAHALFGLADIPRRLMPAAIGLGTFTFTMSALPGSPALQNAIPMPHFGTTPFAAPGLGFIAAAVMLAVGLWWLRRAEAAARRRGEHYDAAPIAAPEATATDEFVRERATLAREFDPAELPHGAHAASEPPFALAALPLAIVLIVNLLMSLVVLPLVDTSFLAEPRWGGVSLSAVGGVWSVIVALAAGIAALVLPNLSRLPSLRQTVDAGANAAVLPLVGVASLVGFGAVVAAMPAFAVVQAWVLGIGGGPIVSLAVAVNLLSALTGSASGGMTIALDALGDTYMHLAALSGISPELLHRVTVLSSGTLDCLPHNGAVVALLGVCGTTHKAAYGDMAATVIAGPVLALIVVLVLGTTVGTF